MPTEPTYPKAPDVVCCKVCNHEVHSSRATCRRHGSEILWKCFKCLDGTFDSQPQPPTGEVTMEHFLTAYRWHVRKVYKWANLDPEKLNNFMASVRLTLESNRVATWNHTGACVTAAWRSLGKTGKPTLKALRGLPRLRTTVVLKSQSMTFDDLFVKKGEKRDQGDDVR